MASGRGLRLNSLHLMSNRDCSLWATMLTVYICIIRGKGERFGRERNTREKPKKPQDPDENQRSGNNWVGVRLVFIPDRAGAFLRSGDNLGHVYLGGRASPENWF